MLTGWSTVGDEREDVAEELRRVRDQARRRVREAEAGMAKPPPDPLPPPVKPSRPGVEAPTGPPPDPPDTGAVNATWRAEAPPSGGLFGPVRRLLERLLGPRLEAQQVFNARQVQLDNEMLDYLARRSAATHRHYDRLLGELGRRLDEVDERHAILEKELVGHVQDLVRRIDLALADGSRGRGALEFALQEVGARLARLEKALRHPE
jgi:hypothetical protein